MSEVKSTNDSSNSTGQIAQTNDTTTLLWLKFYLFLININLFITFVLLIVYYLKIRKNKISNQIKIHLFAWIICSTALCGNTILVFLTNLGLLEFPYKNLPFNFTMSSINFGLLQILPISTSFLVIDRVLAMLLLNHGQQVRFYCLRISIASLVIGFIAYGGTVFIRVVNPSDSSLNLANCSFKCRTENKINDLLFAKMINGWLNSVIGSYFVYLYINYSKKLKFKHERKRNYVVFCLILTELICNVIPTSVFILIPEIPLKYLYLTSGSGLTLSYSFDGIVTVLVLLKQHRNEVVHTKVLHRIIAQNSFRKSGTNTSTNNRVNCL